MSHHFRSFASKLKASAADVAQHLPTFDDMAAKDEYIHSEDFNVKGQKKPNYEARTQQIQQHSRQPQQPSDTSSTASWSLLDRPQGPLTPALGTARQESTRKVGSDTTSFRTSIAAGSKVDKYEEQSPIKKQSSMPLLSVVADSLKQGRSPSPSPPKQTTGIEYESDTSDMGNDNLMEDHDYINDEDDPILSMIRKSTLAPKKAVQKKTPKPEPEKHQTEIETKNDKKKNPNRFLDDLDQRLSTPEARMEEGVDGLVTTAPPASEGNWGWVKDLAVAHVDRIVGGRPTNAKSVEGPRPDAPLARKKPQRIAITPPPEDDFQVTVSSSVLAGEELAQLAKMKQGSILDPLSMLMDSVKENPQLKFIFFTMVLAFFVFFYTRHQTMEDVN
jgi:hypothetical protein